VGRSGPFEAQVLAIVGMAVPKDRKKPVKLTPKQIERERMLAERLWRSKQTRAKKRKKD